MQKDLVTNVTMHFKSEFDLSLVEFVGLLVLVARTYSFRRKEIDRWMAG